MATALRAAFPKQTWTVDPADNVNVYVRSAVRLSTGDVIGVRAYRKPSGQAVVDAYRNTAVLATMRGTDLKSLVKDVRLIAHARLSKAASSFEQEF